MDKEQLLKGNLDEEDVDLPGKGTVRIRALTRAEIHSMNQGKNVTPAVVEQRTLAKALVDPELTYAEVGEWLAAASAGEVQRVVEAVLELSGMSDGAEKEAYQQFRSE